MKAMKMGLEGLLIQNSALTIPSVTMPFVGKNMLWPITYIFCLVKDWEFCKLFSVLWSLKHEKPHKIYQSREVKMCGRL
jgi:hypothetical protein